MQFHISKVPLSLCSPICPSVRYVFINNKESGYLKQMNTITILVPSFFIIAVAKAHFPSNARNYITITTKIATPLVTEGQKDGPTDGQTIF